MTEGIPIPSEVRELLDAPNYVHLSTLKSDGAPRNWIVWVGLEGERILVCTGIGTWKAKDMRRDPAHPPADARLHAQPSMRSALARYGPALSVGSRVRSRRRRR